MLEVTAGRSRARTIRAAAVALLLAAPGPGHLLASGSATEDLADLVPWQLARYRGKLLFEERALGPGTIARGPAEIDLELVYLVVPRERDGDAGDLRLLLLRSAAPRGEHRYELPPLRDASFFGLRRGAALQPEEVRPPLPIDSQLPPEVFARIELPAEGSAFREESVRVHGPGPAKLPLRVLAVKEGARTTVTRALESKASVELNGIPAEVDVWTDSHAFDGSRKALAERRRELRFVTERLGTRLFFEGKEELRLEDLRVLGAAERERAAGLVREIDASLELFKASAEPRDVYARLGSLGEGADLVPGLREALDARLALYRKEKEAAPRRALAAAPKERKPAQDFMLEALDGTKVSFREATRGKVVLLTFWAYGCAPCRSEAPYLTRLQETYGDKGFTVMAVNAWDESRGIVEHFSKKEGLKHPILLKGGSVAREVYRVRSYPTSFWIDAEGYIVGKPEVGFTAQKYPSMAARVESMLGLDKGD